MSTAMVGRRVAPRRALVAGAEIPGGALVIRKFANRGVWHKPGDRLDAQTLLGFPVQNRRSLANRGFIEIYPAAAADPQQPGELIIVNKGYGRFDVIRGVRLNTEPMSKEAAEAFVEKISPKTA